MDNDGTNSVTKPDNSTPPLRLALYDKLWSNITQKENRVWTFLSVYGAAIGISITVGISNDLQHLTTLVIMILTYWAGELIIDTDWWSVRNRAMISCIEEKDTQSTRGVIPSYYSGYKYSASSLYFSSLLVFGLLGLLVISNTYLSFESWSGEPNSQTWFLFISYCGWSLIIARWAHLREKRIDEYTSLYRDLHEKSPVTDKKELAERNSNNFRIEILIGHLLAAVLVLNILLEHTNLRSVIIFVVLEGSALVVFLILYRSYRKNSITTGFSILKIGSRQRNIQLHSICNLILLVLIVGSSYVASLAINDSVSRNWDFNSTRSIKELIEIQETLRSDAEEQIARLEKVELKERSRLMSELAALKKELVTVSNKLDILRAELRTSESSGEGDP